MRNLLAFVLAVLAVFSCDNYNKKPENIPMNKERKAIVYQVFTRLFGNTNTTNKPWGTIEENGVGKFSDFTNNPLRHKEIQHGL